MLKRKNVKKQGKLELSKYFQEFKEGEKVAVVREHTLNPDLPKRIQGRTGIVFGERGKAYLVKIKDLNQEKVYIIKPANLKKIA
ncbi:50S ribosomal protein L21e [Candidatus Pacearchaeota archaeon]|nr:50S ribosomal protein L21e [Candidatus Pacearchaeota archaeon]